MRVLWEEVKALSRARDATSRHGAASPDSTARIPSGIAARALQGWWRARHHPTNTTTSSNGSDGVRPRQRPQRQPPRRPEDAEGAGDAEGVADKSRTVVRLENLVSSLVAQVQDLSTQVRSLNGTVASMEMASHHEDPHGGQGGGHEGFYGERDEGGYGYGGEHGVEQQEAGVVGPGVGISGGPPDLMDIARGLAMDPPPPMATVSNDGHRDAALRGMSPPKEQYAYTDGYGRGGAYANEGGGNGAFDDTGGETGGETGEEEEYDDPFTEEGESNGEGVGADAGAGEIHGEGEYYYEDGEGGAEGEGDEEEDEEDETVQVVEREYEGEVYLVDDTTGDVYNEDGEVIGQWADGSPV